MAKPEKLPVISLLIDLLKDPDRKPVHRMIAEVIYLFFFYGSFPNQYFSRYLFKQGSENIKNYLPRYVLYDKIKPYMNEKEVREVLENKLYFDFFYSQFNISLPKILMYNHKKIFVFDRKTIEINNTEDFKSLLNEIFNLHSSYDSIFIKQTYWSYGGDRIFKLYRHQVTAHPDFINGLYSEVIKSGFLFQETLVQHPHLNRLNASCMNTLRFDTFINSNGEIEIISGYIRMSTNNLHVDNVSSGGCFVGTDLKTGKLRQKGFMSFRNNGVKLLTEHPITKTVFENFSIPYFEDAKNLVIRAAGLMPGLRLVGWDVGIGESGPVLIEGNSDYDIAGNDLIAGGYRANPVFIKVLQEIHYL